MPSPIARAELDRQIDDAVVELQAASAQARVNIFLARMAGGVAALVGRHDLTRRLEAVISGLTVEHLLRGSITNIDSRTVDATRTITLPSSDETARQHPACDDDSILAGMNAQGDPHVRLCLNGDIEGAAQAATTPLALEDIGSRLAAMGRSDQAIVFINGRSMSDNARASVRFVILLEKCRRGLPGFEDAIHEAKLEGYARLHVALALAGRLPWVGYPYSDY